ncbi:LRR domain containing protein [Parasponia andersonii]|uniref:LRR domain containing protein n=1 Tax=Parasponia andersonii TaxID=3476 RepID=A0A2P5DM18_PARAD|nr:LRR domain containing protein [Parasponia andersonii]
MHDAELDAVKGLKNLVGEFQIKNLRHEKDVTVYVNVVACGVRSLSLEWDSHAPKSKYNATSPEDGKLFQDLEELAVNGFNGVTLFSPDISSKMVKLTLRRCANCQYLPSLDQLLHLKVLLLDEMIKLEYISNKDSSSASTTFFPCLQELWLTELPKLRGWCKNGVNDLTASFPCLSKLVIEDCPNLATMPLFPTLEEGLVLDTTYWRPFELTMKHATAAYDEASSSTSPPPSAPLSKLKNLSIVGIKDCKVDEIKWETLNCLRFLRFDSLPNLTTLPKGLQRVTSLQELHVWRCGIKEIPSWINKLEQLKKLAIRVCSSLKSLPEEIRSLHSLETLEIEDCNTLLRRCEKEIGADWEKIVPIPYKRLGPISGR